MKRTVKIIGVLFSVLCLACTATACEVGEVKVDDEWHIEGKTNANIEQDNIYIITDAETGVQYVVYREHSGYAGMGGITPRLNADGTLHVVETERNE